MAVGTCLLASWARCDQQRGGGKLFIGAGGGNGSWRRARVGRRTAGAVDKVGRCSDGFADAGDKAVRSMATASVVGNEIAVVRWRKRGEAQ